MIKVTKPYYILVRTAGLKRKGYNADISYDARQLDEQMETFFAEVSKKRREWLRLGIRHFACRKYRTFLPSRRSGP